MPGPDPRKNRKEGKRMGPKTFVVGKDGKREVLRGSKPVKEMPEQPTIQLPPKKLLTGGQSKIAKKAPPFNKIDEKDFEVLRAEKAKGRGKGLQDEKVKPGKVIKAKEGKLVIWPSDFTHPHRGIVSLDEEKYIVTGWLEIV